MPFTGIREDDGLTIDGVVTDPPILDKIDGTANPAVTDDSAAGYAVGSRWLNVTSGEEFLCTDASAGAAVWKSTTASPVGAHDFAGGEHNTDTLADVNAKISDATLIDTTDSRLSDARTPTAHNHAAGDITSGTLADARISQSSVDQHATGTATATRIPLADGSGKLDTWISDASDSAKGKIELATQGEVDAGTDTVRAVTPATLSNYSGVTRVDSFRMTLNGTVSGSSAVDGLWIAARAGKFKSVRAITESMTGKTIDIEAKKTSTPTVDLPSGGTSILTATLSMTVEKTVYIGSMKSNGDEDFAANDVFHADVTLMGAGANPSDLTIIIEVEYS